MFQIPDRKWDCILQWNPINFKTRTNVVGYRVKKMDESWAIYNNSRGIHILELNSTSCLPGKLRIFDTGFANKTEQTKFMNYVDNVPTGTIMIGYSVGNFFDSGIQNYLMNRLKTAYDITRTFSLAFSCFKINLLVCSSQSSQNAYGYGYLVIIPGLLLQCELTNFIKLIGQYFDFCSRWKYVQGYYATVNELSPQVLSNLR